MYQKHYFTNKYYLKKYFRNLFFSLYTFFVVVIIAILYSIISHRLSIADVGNLATFFLLLLAIYQYQNSYKIKQAKNISSWINFNLKDSKSNTWIEMLNRSEGPVYEVVICLVPLQGAGDSTGKNIPEEYRVFIGVLPPGKYYTKLPGGWGGMMFHPSASIAFIDSLENSWVREGNGYLHTIPVKPPEYYMVPRPISWDYPLDKPLES